MNYIVHTIGFGLFARIGVVQDNCCIMAVGTIRTPLAESILRTLLYYDIFSYPLTQPEIFRFLPTNGVSQENVNAELENLCKLNLIYRLDNFFSVRNEPVLSNRRTQGNQLAEGLMKKAARRSKLIARFPFVRAVMVSGSLSKGYMDKDSDVDFFIITAPGRLWITRMILVLFKRIFLFNSHKFFCVNYFIDTQHLEIDEKNLFTATELATLLPMVNPALYGDLMTNNQWLANFFPNYRQRATDLTQPAVNSIAKKATEAIINVLYAGKLERIFKRATYRRWTKMYQKNYAQPDFEIAFKTNEHVSKNHPRNYQRKVIEQYEAKLAEFPFTKTLLQSA